MYNSMKTNCLVKLYLVNYYLKHTQNKTTKCVSLLHYLYQLITINNVHYFIVITKYYSRDMSNQHFKWHTSFMCIFLNHAAVQLSQHF